MTKQLSLRITTLLCLNIFILNLFAQNQKDGQAYLNEALEHKKAEQFHASIVDFKRAIPLLEASGNQAAVIQAELGLANSFKAIAHIRDAQMILKGTIRKAETAFGSKSIEYGKAALEYGVTLHFNAEYDKARRYLKSVIKILEKEKENLLLAKAWQILGWTYSAEGFTLESLEYYKNAEAIYETKEIEDNYWRCRLYAAMTGVYRGLGWMKLTDVYRTKSKIAFEKIMPGGVLKGHCAIDLSGQLLIPEADSLLNQTEKDVAKILGPDNLISRNAKQMRMGYSQNQVEMQKIMEKNYAIFLDSIPNDTISHAKLINRMGLNQVNLKNYRKALEYFQEAETLFKTTLSENNLNLIVVKENQAYAYWYLNEIDLAYSIISDCLEKRREKYGAEGLGYVGMLTTHTLNECHKKMGKDTLTIQNAERQITIYRKILGDSTINLNTPNQIIGYVYNDRRDAQKSNEYFLRAWDVVKSLGAEFNTSKYLAANMIVINYGNQNQYKKELEWFHREVSLVEQDINLLPFQKNQRLSSTYVRLQDYHDKFENRDSTVFYLEKSFELLDSLQNDYPVKIATIGYNIGEQNNLKRAKEIMYRAAKVGERRIRENRMTKRDEASLRFYQFMYYTNYTNKCDSTRYYFDLWNEAAKVSFEAKHYQNSYFSLKRILTQGCELTNSDSLIKFKEDHAAFYEKHYPKDLENQWYLYHDLFSLYLDRGEREKAIEMKNKYLSLRHNIVRKNPDAITLRENFLTDKVKVHRWLEEADSVKIALDVLASFVNDNQLDSSYQANVQNQYGIYENNINFDLRKSVEHYRRAMDLIPKTPQNHPTYRIYKRNLVETLLLLEEAEEAFNLIVELETDPFFETESISEREYLYILKGRALRRLGKFEEAMESFWKAFEIVGGDRNKEFQKEKVNVNPELFMGIYPQIAYVNQMAYKKTKQRKYLEDALRFSDYTWACLDIQSSAWRTEDEERLLNIENRNYGWYLEDAVQIRLDFYHLTGEEVYLNEAYSILEKGKSRIFKRNLELEKSGTMSSHALRRLKRIDEQMTRLRLQYSKKTEESLRREIRQELEDLANDKEIFEKHLTDVERRLYKQEISAEDVRQKILSDGETLIQFHFTDSMIITALIQKDTLAIKSQKTPADFREALKIFRGEVSKSNPLPSKLAGKGHYIFQTLFSEIEDLMTEDLLIIPDGELFYLPFEVLLTKKVRRGQYKDLPFMLQKYNIRYAASAQMLLSMTEQKSEVYDVKFAGFAPTYEGLESEEVVRDWIFENIKQSRGGLGELKFNRTEIERICELFRRQNARMFLGQEATLDNFNQFVKFNIPQILHLAVHAKADERFGQNSFIVFSYNQNEFPDIRLRARDVRKNSLNLPVEMLVLSGCETGIGKLRDGEGVIGFNRMFTQSQAKSIVSSLWAVDDEKTQQLMVNFYENLNNGEEKHTAMRKAKMELLNQNVAPFYWGAFTVFGDVRVLR
jgi:CHAT domain-containing protein